MLFLEGTLGRMYPTAKMSCLADYQVLVNSH